ncbi:Hypothetical_protein [Hexamita inflata]|uniref:Hypothetical_protein n=1 Tax=Hexamita inflata TaxID=28002 RepID=A0AA86QBS5_9EUKA|nr:Hypothetical protein HINF_LOCUS41696 [Hexamita inflata]
MYCLVHFALEKYFGIVTVCKKFTHFEVFQTFCGFRGIHQFHQFRHDVNTLLERKLYIAPPVSTHTLYGSRLLWNTLLKLSELRYTIQKRVVGNTFQTIMIQTGLILQSCSRRRVAIRSLNTTQPFVFDKSSNSNSDLIHSTHTWQSSYIEYFSLSSNTTINSCQTMWDSILNSFA